MFFPPTLLEAAAAGSVQIRAAVLLSFAGGALAIAIALTAWPVFRRHSPTLALAYVVACAVSCSLDAVHNSAVMAVLSLSQRFAEASAPNLELYQLLSAMAASARKWAHYSQLAGFGAWIFLFYALLWRCALVPRTLAGLGLAGILLQFAGVTLPRFAGYPSVMQLAMPLGPIHLATAVWLIAKGFGEGRPSFGAGEANDTLSPA
jgi:hypothetical protein